MAYNKADFLAGIAAGRAMKSWPVLDQAYGRFIMLLTVDDTSKTFQISVTRDSALNDPVIISWGDGNNTTITSASRNISKRYTTTGDYFVTISGPMTGFRANYLGNGDTVLRAVLTPFPKSMGARTALTQTFSGCAALEWVNPGLLRYLRNLTDVSYLFSGCTHLTIPSGIFDGIPFLTTFHSTFSNAGRSAAPQVIPNDLFKDCVNAVNFERCFAYANISTIPDDLFNSTPLATNFRACFATAMDFPTITTAVPDLWNRFPDADGFSCFYLQSAIPNYADIPAGWK